MPFKILIIMDINMSYFVAIFFIKFSNLYIRTKA